MLYFLLQLKIKEKEISTMKKIAILCGAVLGIFCSAAVVSAADAVDYSTIGKDWRKGAFKIVNGGWSKPGLLKTAADIENVPYFSPGNSNAGALPYNNHFFEFKLAKSEKVTRIVLELDLTDAKYPVKDADFAQAMVYTSADGKKFTPVKPEIAPAVAYINRDKVFHWAIKGGAGAQITLKGNFEGEYFRVYMPWARKDYKFRLIMKIDCLAFAK